MGIATFGHIFPALQINIALGKLSCLFKHIVPGIVHIRGVVDPGGQYVPFGHCSSLLFTSQYVPPSMHLVERGDVKTGV